MQLPEPQSSSFSTLIGDIEKGLIKIPQFQRDFVWNKPKSAKLNGDPLDTGCDRVQDYEIAWTEFERRFETTKRSNDTK